MINPTSKDIGRRVTYTGNRYPGGQLEVGIITSFNGYCVFVRYDDDRHSKQTDREDLEWTDVGPAAGEPVTGYIDPDAPHLRRNEDEKDN